MSANSRFLWATVTAVDPLRVRLDGDVDEVPTAPASLIDPADLEVGDRLRVELSNRRLIVHGRAWPA